MQEREIKQLYLHYISLDSWSLYKRISVCDRNINILHIHKYKRTPQTVGSVMWCSAASTPHILLWVSARTAGHDQVQRQNPKSVRGERVLAHHQPLLLHSAVLKPDFHLLVAQVQPVGQLLPLLSVDEFVHQKFIFEFGQLQLGVGLSLLPALYLRRAPRSTWGMEEDTDSLSNQALRHYILTWVFFFCGFCCTFYKLDQ